MSPKLYMHPASPPVRAVLMTAKFLNIELETELVDIMAQQNLTPEYLEKNPMHTIPTLEDDDGFIIYDSHAIIEYLVEKYADDDSLYPNDTKARAIITQRMHFNSGVIQALCNKTFQLLSTGQKIDNDLKMRFLEAYGFLEAMLEKGSYVAGNTLSMADFCIIAAVTTANLFVKLNEKNYPKVVAWTRRMEAFPCYRLNKTGLAILKKAFNLM